MHRKDTTLQPDQAQPQRYRGRLGVGHIPTLIVALCLWWWILSALPIGD